MTARIGIGGLCLLARLCRYVNARDGIVIIFLGISVVAGGQAQTANQVSKTIETIPRVPGVSSALAGANAGLTYSAVHNSSNGWYTVLTPAVSYTFSPRYSIDASGSLYFHRLVENLNPVSSESLTVDNASAGDTIIGAHASLPSMFVLDTLSAYLIAPTGDRSAGLGTGKVSFEISNHVEKYRGSWGALLDIGAGNSSNVFNSFVNRNYSSYGGLATFQAGTVWWLPKNAYFESIAYEQLPLGSQTVYSFAGSPGNPFHQITSGSRFAEDNGFVTFAGLPLTSHLTLSGYYTHSLRRQTDTVSLGVTYVLRTPRAFKRLSMIDRALREAEKAATQSEAPAK